MDLQGSLRFIVDANAGKLAIWLRVLGYDTLFFNYGEDSWLVNCAIKEERVIVTRDTRIAKYKLVKNGTLKLVTLKSDSPDKQLEQVINELKIDLNYNPFSRCLNCNELLFEPDLDKVKERVPPYVFRTQEFFRECPECHRIYWRGTHWKAMNRHLKKWQDLASPYTD